MRRRPSIRGNEDLTDLLVRAASGDRAAEEAFVARSVDDVWRYCRHVMGPDLADDATQATYLRALRSMSGFRGESSAKTWLIGVARNTCLDLRRSLGRKARLDDRLTALPIDPTDDLHAQTLPLEFHELLDGLAPERREAFVLTQMLGFSYEATSELVGAPIGTVRSRVARARRDLRILAGDDVGPIAQTGTNET